MMLDASGPGIESLPQPRSEGADRIENLEELINAAEAFVTQEGFGKRCRGPAGGRDRPGQPDARRAQCRGGCGGDTRRRDRRDHVAAGRLFDPRGAGSRRQPGPGNGQDAIQLMTVHSAKGLEFDAVFITGLEEAPVPARERDERCDDGLEEERRLMYVAITRARQRLYLSFSADPAAARPDPLQREEPLFRRAARSRAEVDHAAQRRFRLRLCPRVPAGLGSRRWIEIGGGHGPGGRGDAACSARARGGHVTPWPTHRPGRVPHQVRRRRDPHAWKAAAPMRERR